MPRRKQRMFLMDRIIRNGSRRRVMNIWVPGKEAEEERFRQERSINEEKRT